MDDIYVIFMDYDCPTNAILVGPFPTLEEANDWDGPIGYTRNVIRCINPKKGA